MKFKLKDIEIFSYFNDDDISVLEGFFRPLVLQAKESSKEEDERNRQFFIVLSGRIESFVSFGEESEKKKEKPWARGFFRNNASVYDKKMPPGI